VPAAMVDVWPLDAGADAGADRGAHAVEGAVPSGPSAGRQPS
jgi:hypothetical protein